MEITLNFKELQINTYKEMLKELADAFGNCMCFTESQFSMNDKEQNSIIFVGDLWKKYKWEPGDKIRKEYNVKYHFIVNDNLLEHVSMELTFYENNEEKTISFTNPEIYKELLQEYDFTIYRMPITPLKLYRLICVLFADYLMVNCYQKAKDESNIFLKSLQRKK